MTAVRCQIVRWISDDPQPGLVEARLIDADGRVWAFVDKQAMFSKSILAPSTTFPVPGMIRCLVSGLDPEANRDQVVTITTARPDGLESDGTTTFFVNVSALVD